MKSVRSDVYVLPDAHTMIWCHEHPLRSTVNNALNWMPVELAILQGIDPEIRGIR